MKLKICFSKHIIKASIFFILLVSPTLYYLYVVINGTDNYAQTTVELQLEGATGIEIYNDQLYFEDKSTSEVENKHLPKTYLELDEMKASIINGTFDWSKTARSILFLKKHKCASSTVKEALRNDPILDLL